MGTRGVEDGAKGKVQTDVMFMAANDAIKVQTKLSQIEVLSGQRELLEEGGGGEEGGRGGREDQEVSY